MKDLEKSGKLELYVLVLLRRSNFFLENRHLMKSKSIHPMKHTTKFQLCTILGLVLAAANASAAFVIPISAVATDERNNSRFSASNTINATTALNTTTLVLDTGVDTRWLTNNFASSVQTSQQDLRPCPSF